MWNQLILSVIILSISIGNGRADTPANCSYDEIEGSWYFHVGQVHPYLFNVAGNSCQNFIVKYVVPIKLQYPNLAIDEFGNYGHWTLVYDQGFEVVIGHRKYFAFSDYRKKGNDVKNHYISICNATKPGWTHDSLERQWACFYGSKKRLDPGSTAKHQHVDLKYDKSDRIYTPNIKFIDEINRSQKYWKATVYGEYLGKTLDQLHRQSGGATSYVKGPSVGRTPLTAEQRRQLRLLPVEFDWRSVTTKSGDKNVFVSPVRTQEYCGSCYAFASTSLLESRIRIATDGRLRPILSPQHVVDCSPYSQGCNGGFPYLVGGKFAEDFGLVDDNCYPYGGWAGQCNVKSNCTRYYGTNYGYVGGYYGAGSEELMLLAMVNEGPLAVGFEVYHDFRHYKSGVYHHTGLKDKFNPFVTTSHAVLVVGYGYDPKSNLKYWTVKNSWGEKWGDRGYFKIRRGNNECGIESMAVTVESVL